MIERTIAEKVKEITLSCAAQLDRSTKEAADGTSQEHAAMYRRMVGQVMGHLLTEILMPIYQSYPDLEPEEIKRAKQNILPIYMSSETGAKLMRTVGSVALSLKGLGDSLPESSEGDGSARLQSEIRVSIDLLLHIQEFLRRVCPDLDHQAPSP